MLPTVKFKTINNKIMIDNADELLEGLPFIKGVCVYRSNCGRSVTVWVNKEDAVWPDEYKDFKFGLYYGELLLRQSKIENRDNTISFNLDLLRTDKTQMSMPVFYKQEIVEEQGERLF